MASTNEPEIDGAVTRFTDELCWREHLWFILAPEQFPLLYRSYLSLSGRLERPIVNIEQQHDQTRGLAIMIHVQGQTNHVIHMHDLKQQFPRKFYTSQEKFGMSNNGKHGDNTERKGDSEGILLTFLEICRYSRLLRWFEHQRDVERHEIDDMCDAINLGLATARRILVAKAKGIDPKSLPNICGFCIDEHGYLLIYCQDPGTRQFAHAIIAVAGVLYPPRTGSKLLNDVVKNANIDDALLSFRVLLVEMIDLKSSTTTCSFRDEDDETFYTPSDEPVRGLIEAAVARHEAQKTLNRQAGARQAALTRRANASGPPPPKKQKVAAAAAAAVTLDIVSSEETQIKEPVV